ncbi:MAG: uridine kinase [Acidimicrobiia bacterium]
MDQTLHQDWPAPGRDTRLVIGLAGGTGSGKTTVAEAIVHALDGERVAFLEHDAYYQDLRPLPFEERAAQNFDHPDAFETDLMIDHLRQLRAGQAVDKPIYDYSTHLRTEQSVPVEPAPVIVVEGILVLAEPELRDLMDLKIFVDTDADLRFVRRIQRDIKERGRSPESVIEQYLATVRPMHLQFVEPSKRHADMIIPEGYNPGAVATVISMIRDYLTRH